MKIPFIKKIKLLLFDNPFPKRISTRGIKRWPIKYIPEKERYEKLSENWFIVNSRYPNPKILKKGEIGADIHTKTRYVVR